jgi:hypothetical protein
VCRSNAGQQIEGTKTMTATATAGAPPAQSSGWGQTAENHFAASADNFDFDSDGVDTSKVSNETRFDLDKPGKYHFAIQAFEKLAVINESNGEQVMPHVSLALNVIHTVEGQSPEGFVLFANLWLAGKGGAPREEWQTTQTMNLLKGLGLVVEKDGKLVDPETGTTKLNWRTWVKRLDGMQCIGDVKMSRPDATRLDPRTQKPYPARPELPFGRGLYQVDDPKVKDVPKNAAALATIGKAHAAPETPAKATATSPTGKAAVAPAAPVSPPPAPVAPAAPADDDLDI